MGPDGNTTDYGSVGDSIKDNFDKINIREVTNSKYLVREYMQNEYEKEWIDIQESL